MAKEKKHPKERSKNYDQKLAVKGTFADVFKVVKKNKEDNAPKDTQKP